VAVVVHGSRSRDQLRPTGRKDEIQEAKVLSLDLGQAKIHNGIADESNAKAESGHELRPVTLRA
jgi:hypothetical protein